MSLKIISDVKATVCPQTEAAFNTAIVFVSELLAETDSCTVIY